MPDPITTRWDNLRVTRLAAVLTGLLWLLLPGAQAHEPRPSTWIAQATPPPRPLPPPQPGTGPILSGGDRTFADAFRQENLEPGIWSDKRARISPFSDEYLSLESAQESVSNHRRLAKKDPSLFPLLAQDLIRLSQIYFSRGQRIEALHASQEAAEISKSFNHISDNSFVHARALTIVALCLGAVGRRAEGVQIAEQVVRLFRQQSNLSSPYLLDGYRLALSVLSGAYGGTGRFAEAVAINVELIALTRRMQAQNQAHVYSARSLEYSLLAAYGALAESALKAHDAANYQLAIIDGSKIFPDLLATARETEELRIVSIYQIALASNAILRKDYKKAIAIFRELIDRARSGPLARAYPVVIGVSLHQMAVAYIAVGDFANAYKASDQAEVLYRDLSRASSGYHFGLYQALVSKLLSCRKMSTCRDKSQILRNIIAIQARHLADQAGQIPESRRAVFLDAVSWDDVVYQDALSGAESAALALLTRLNRQGLLLELQRRQVLTARDGAHRLLYAQIQEITQKRSNTTLSARQRQKLLSQQEELEYQLYRQLPQAGLQLVEPAQVANLLPADAVLLEFQKYHPEGGFDKPYLPAHYLALMLRQDGTVRAFPLGASEAIDAAIAEAVTASADPKRQSEAPGRLAAVSTLLFKPLQSELVGVRELFLSPDGELNRLPFAALTFDANKDNYLGDSIRLRLLTSGRDLVVLNKPPTAPGSAATIIANPDFSSNTYLQQRSDNKSQWSVRDSPVGSSQVKRGPWKPLPETAHESELISPILGVKTAVTGSHATASLVAQLKSPKILHIATHGFFLSETEDSAMTLADPLQLSGLVFAGANFKGATTGDDGYLTAAEVLGIDLDGTELVTLSACDTARGSVRNGEGVYGLQRALAVAGARSTLLSLWRVEDDLTALFMEEYYKRLKAGEGRADALRDTQAWFRRSNSSTLRDVRVWAAFQLRGDWRPIKTW